MTSPEGTDSGRIGVPSEIRMLIDLAADGFADLGVAAPDGLLDIQPTLSGVRAIRLEVPAGQALELQSIGIEADGVPSIRTISSVRASRSETPIDVDRLLAFDHPTGTSVRTQPEHPAWIEVAFSERVTVTRIRLRNASGDAGHRPAGLKVSAKSGWRTRVVYDRTSRERAWRDQVAASRARVGSDPVASPLLEVLDLTVRGDYAKAHTLLASRVPSDATRHLFRDALNERLLPSRGLEWTVHGPQRPFRLWSEQERVDYVRGCAEVLEVLAPLTANACLGFGSVLSVVRDQDLVPHDDDLDIIVGFELSEASTLKAGLTLIEDHLRAVGFDVTGAFAAHRHVRRPGRRRVDVFVGLFEGDAISWYPGARRALTREMMFPASSASLLGIDVAIPKDAERYLGCVYGPDWRVPDPHFSHEWDLASYADISGATAKAT